MTALVTMRPALRMRLHFIECLLAHYGTINRSVIEDYWGVSTPQASMDIQAYLALAPGNAEYDVSAKTYRRGLAFTWVFA